jgi:hypothetical protein
LRPLHKTRLHLHGNSTKTLFENRSKIFRFYLQSASGEGIIELQSINDLREQTQLSELSQRPKAILPLGAFFVFRPQGKNNAEKSAII